MFQGYSAADLIEVLMPIGIEASRFLRSAYAQHQLSSIEVNRKADNSLLTHADLNVHKLINSALISRFPDIPVVSEEGFHGGTSERDGWPWYWLIDPLDGTREFVEKTGEYCINIALMKAGTPWLGMILQPEDSKIFVGGKQLSVQFAREGQSWQALPQFAPDNTVSVVTSSRNADTKVINQLINAIKADGFAVRTVVAGSAAKYCLLAASGRALYPRYGLTSHWDTAAGQALVEAAGGAIIGRDGSRLRYPAKTLLNPSFIGLSPACNTEAERWVAMFSETFK